MSLKATGSAFAPASLLGYFHDRQSNPGNAWREDRNATKRSGKRAHYQGALSESRDLRPRWRSIELAAMNHKVRLQLLSSTVLSLALTLSWDPAAMAAGAASAWTEGYNNKSRLLSGAGLAPSEAPLFAGFEIAMPPGWKTYWRSPGDAGGVPPSFDWSGSENLGSAHVLYPAPHRLIDKSGAAIGYKDHVLLPIEIMPKDAAKPVKLRLKAEYGVCKDICIPAEAAMELDIGPAPDVSSEISEAFALVPRTTPKAGADPVITKWAIEGADTKPVLKIEVSDPGGQGGDAFVEAPEGLYVPVPKKTSDANSRATYEVDLSDGVDFQALRGQNLTVTLVGAKGQSQAVIKID